MFNIYLFRVKFSYFNTKRIKFINIIKDHILVFLIIFIFIILYTIFNFLYFLNNINKYYSIQLYIIYFFISWVLINANSVYIFYFFWELLNISIYFYLCLHTLSYRSYKSNFLFFCLGIFTSILLLTLFFLQPIIELNLFRVSTVLTNMLIWIHISGSIFIKLGIFPFILLIPVIYEYFNIYILLLFFIF